MAISLNNHEQRIVALENQTSTSGYTETVLWSGKQSGNGTANLSQSMTNFDALKIVGTNSIWGGYYTSGEVLVSRFKTQKTISICMIESSNCAITYKTDTQVSTWGNEGYILQIIGVNY